MAFSFLNHGHSLIVLEVYGYEARLTRAGSFSLAHMMGIRNCQETLSHTQHIISAIGMHRTGSSMLFHSNVAKCILLFSPDRSFHAWKRMQYTSILADHAEIIYSSSGFTSAGGVRHLRQSSPRRVCRGTMHGTVGTRPPWLLRNSARRRGELVMHDIYILDAATPSCFVDHTKWVM